MDEDTPDVIESDRTVSTRRAPGPRSAPRSRADQPAVADTDPIEPRPRQSDSRAREYPGGTGRGAEDRSGELHTGAVAEATVPTNIYRARRPAVAIFLVIPAVALGALLVRALAISAFGSPFNTGGLIGSSLALASLPLLVGGLYGLITGAAHGAEQFGFKVWARPPLAYLVVGIAFVLAAGLAVRG